MQRIVITDGCTAVRRRTVRACRPFAMVFTVALLSLAGACLRSSDAPAAHAEPAEEDGAVSQAPDEASQAADAEGSGAVADTGPAPQVGIPTAPPAAVEPPPAPTPPAGLGCLMRAYPDLAVGAVQTETGAWVLEFASGDVLPWGEADAPTHADAIEAHTLRDMFRDAYPAGAPDGPPPFEFDPGRYRHEPLFDAIYGATEAEVRERLVRVPWAPSGGTVRFHSAAGAAEALEQVGIELAANLDDDAMHCVRDTAGSFNWRNIAGTDRRSVHSWAAAIDMNVDCGNYWRWSRRDDGTFAWANDMPMDVVAVFERHGFIWGGRWYHFDSPHFEYRPELLDPACVGEAAPGDVAPDRGGATD